MDALLAMITSIFWLATLALFTIIAWSRVLLWGIENGLNADLALGLYYSLSGLMLAGIISICIVYPQILSY
jgi:hypothetical protein